MKQASPFRIGVFVILAFALFAAGLLAFGAKSYFKPKTHFETAIPNEVYGLSVGSPVQLRGVPVGKVSRIDFPWNAYPGARARYIIVEFDIDTQILPALPGMTNKQVVDMAVENGLRALVKGQGITGTSMLALENLDPHAYPPPKLDYIPKRYYIPAGPAQFARVLESIERSLGNIQQIDFAAIGDGLAETLQSANSLTRKMSQVDMKRIGKDTSTLMAQLQETNARLRFILDRLATGPGTTELRSALQNLNEVLWQMKQYPAGFFFGQPPAPAKSVRPAKR